MVVTVPQDVNDFLRAYTGNFGFLVDMKGQLMAGNRPFTEKQVAAVQRCMRRESSGPERRDRTAVTPSRERVEQDGMYRTLTGEIFKVQHAVNGSGRLYAKKLVRRDDNESGWGFEYAPGAIRELTPGMRMTLEQAREFGALYGTCCVCGRTLTDEISISRGIGPVCEGRQDWEGELS